MSNNLTTRLVVSALVSGLFVFFAFQVLTKGHLHEDAYILFQYAENNPFTSGIAFDRVSGPTEGATDFLWLLMVASLAPFIGSGAAAAVLNGLGAFAIAWVLLSIRGRLDWIVVGCLLAVMLSGGTAAALGGFSTLAYAGLFVLMTYFALREKYFPFFILALSLSLFRPDGVILSFGAVLSVLIWSGRNEKRRLALGTICLVLLGALYFLWRWQYFGFLLPLPLLVKQKTDYLFEGLSQNFHALKYFLPAVTVILFWGAWDRRRLAVVFLGPSLLLLSLTFAHQSQNIGYRFQFVSIVAICLAFAAFISERGLKGFGFALIIVVGAQQGVRIIKSDLAYLKNNDYINSFPQLLKKSEFRLDSIALTEAGRFPYWFNARSMLDLVGLNSADVVRYGAERALELVKPQLIFVHHAGRYSNERFYDGADFKVVNVADIVLADYSGRNPVLTAPEYALSYARRYKYQAVLVRYGAGDKDYSHVYFLSPDLDVDAFLKVLKLSFDKKISYLESRKLILRRVSPNPS